MLGDVLPTLIRLNEYSQFSKQTPPECALIGRWATHSSDLVHWFSIWAESSWGSQRAEVIYARTARRTVEFPVMYGDSF